MRARPPLRSAEHAEGVSEVWAGGITGCHAVTKRPEHEPLAIAECRDTTVRKKSGIDHDGPPAYANAWQRAGLSDAVAMTRIDGGVIVRRRLGGATLAAAGPARWLVDPAATLNRSPSGAAHAATREPRHR